MALLGGGWMQQYDDNFSKKIILRGLSVCDNIGTYIWENKSIEDPPLYIKMTDLDRHHPVQSVLSGRWNPSLARMLTNINFHILRDMKNHVSFLRHSFRIINSKEAVIFKSQNPLII